MALEAEKVIKRAIELWAGQIPDDISAVCVPVHC